MNHKNYIANSKLLLLYFAFYCDIAIGTGITTGIPASGRMLMVFKIFFVFPLICLSIIFALTKWYCKKRDFSKFGKHFNTVFIILILALLVIALILVSSVH